MRKTWMLVAAFVLVGGCSDDDVTPPKADKGMIADLSKGDGTTAPDMGAKDNGPIADKGATDTGPASDTATGTPCATGFASCTTFDDKTADTTVTVDFGTAGFEYTPKCIKVKAGTKIDFKGDFTAHPFKATCGPAMLPDSGQPSGSGTFTVDTTGLASGVYGYFCTAHGTAAGSGMAGAIEIAAP